MKTIILLTLIFISVQSTAQIPSYVPSNGLVGWWPFNGNANDESGNINNGTVNGATLTTDRNGLANAAYSFDGSTNYISVNDNATLDVSNVTVSAWFWANDYGTVQQQTQGHIVSKREQSGWGASFQLALEQSSPVNGIWGTYTINGQNGWVSYNSNSILTTSNWIHAVYCQDNNFAKLFINGSLVANTPVSGGLSVNDLPMWIGARPNAGSLSHFFHGSLDDIGIWNRALTEQEILALYQGCQMSITAQPTNQSVNLSGGNASFNVVSNATNPIYQWQTNVGVGFQNLSNVGQYSGVNTANLSVSNLTPTNDNQAFRCIISDVGCEDTSDVATLYIIDDASINSQLETSLILSPNPISNDFSISGIEQIVSLSLKDVSGKLIKTFDVQEKNYSISNLTSGVYFLEVSDEKRTYMIKVIKE